MTEYFNYQFNLGEIALQFSNSLSIEEREIHSYHEILYCEGANLILRTESGILETCGKQLFVIPKGKYHMFELSGVKQFTRLKISISDAIVKKLNVGIFDYDICVISYMTQCVTFLIEKLCDMISKETNEFYINSAIMMILAELNLNVAELNINTKECLNSNEAIFKVAEYISEHLSSNLNVELLAKTVNVSPSFLTHKFQKEVGISLHRYIVQKRMVYAKERIDLGERPSKIYVDCGYRDYSSFYKAYLNFFGVSPSQNK